MQESGFRIYHMFQMKIVKVYLSKSNWRKFIGIVKRKGFHQKFRFSGWQTILYPLSNNILIQNDKRLLTKISNFNFKNINQIR